MTAIRVGFLFALESSYGMGKGESYEWIAPPPGSYISTQHHRAAQRIQSTGTKFWDTVAYGKLTGSFTWTFTMDYKYLEPFFLVFEQYVDPTVSSGEGDVGSKYYHTQDYHTFAKQDGKRMPSFVIRRKILNHITNGVNNTDEMTELRGCVVRNFRVSKASNTSQINIEMTGFYANEVMVEGYLPTTDYQAYDGQLSEYMCMFTADDNVNVDNQYSYVANTDSLSLGVSNNADAIYTTCSPFAKNYYEGTSDFEFSTSCWSNDIHRYKTRLYKGGKQYTGAVNNTYYPQTKNLAPLPGIKLYSYDGTQQGNNDETGIINTIQNSEHVSVFNIRDCVIKSLTWPKADGSKIQDVISSAECRNIWLEVKSAPDDGKSFNPAASSVQNGVESLDIGAYPVTIISDGHGVIGPSGEEGTGTYSFYISNGTYSLSTNNLLFSNDITIVPTADANYTFSKWQYEETVITNNTSGANGITETGREDVTSATTYNISRSVILHAVFAPNE